jgi:hypothetical protein
VSCSAATPAGRKTAESNTMKSAQDKSRPNWSNGGAASVNRGGRGCGGGIAQALATRAPGFAAPRMKRRARPIGLGVVIFFFTPRWKSSLSPPSKYIYRDVYNFRDALRFRNCRVPGTRGQYIYIFSSFSLHRHSGEKKTQTNLRKGKKKKKKKKKKERKRRISGKRFQKQPSMIQFLKG